MWKSLGCIMVNGVPRDVPRPKTLGACSSHVHLICSIDNKLSSCQKCSNWDISWKMSKVALFRPQMCWPIGFCGPVFLQLWLQTFSFCCLVMEDLSVAELIIALPCTVLYLTVLHFSLVDQSVKGLSWLVQWELVAGVT